MFVTRRRLALKLTICVIYAIGVIVIAKRLFNTENYYDNASRVSDDFVGKHRFFEVSAELGLKFSLENIKKFEEWIKKYDNNVVPNLGKNGEAAHLSESDKDKGERSLATKALNVVLSDRIPLRRKLPDVRDPLCANVTYDNYLPTASVVIIFYNEPWSVLLRTVESVLLETPPDLLREIILVDDYSDEVELKELFSYYIATRLPRKVKLIRLSQRSGLIRARLSGAENCTGDVLVFLDAHCEVTKDWILPLLQRINEKSNAVVMPIIDNISEETLAYIHENEPSFFQVGGFTWSGHFTWINIQQSELSKRSIPISPVRSPTMAGGLYAIDRSYFWEVGSYDDKMDGWGGENLEMSFRIWQCGGSLEIIPCSRVGHIFRNFHPYKFPSDKDTHGINTARVAYVWMDEYKRLFLLHRNEFKDIKLIGDISQRLALRTTLNCKSFRWYLDNIYPEKFIPDENVVAYGRVKLRSRPLCLDNLQRDDDKPFNLGLYGCHDKLFPSQLLSLSNSGELRRDESCARVIGLSLEKNPKVQMMECDDEKVGQEWVFSEDGEIIHVYTGLCLDATGLGSGQDVAVSVCKESLDQYWQFDFHNTKKKY